MQNECKLCGSAFEKAGEPYFTEQGKVCRDCLLKHKLKCICGACTAWRKQFGQ